MGAILISPANSGSSDSDTTVRSEKLYTLWKLATLRGLDDKGRIAAILAEACRVLGADVAMVGEVVGDDYHVRHAHDPRRRLTAGMSMLLSETPCQRVMATGESVFLHDLNSEPGLRQLPVVSALKMLVYAGTPIWVGERMWGALAFAGRKPVEVARTRDNLAFIELIAAWLGQLLLQTEQRQGLEDLALSDSLTGLANRRAAVARLNEEVARMRRRHERFALALLDIDHFKLINDRYGHAVGDEVLVELSAYLRSLMRAEDWAARWGGEEFLLCLHSDNIQEAALVLDRIRDKIATRGLPTRIGEIRLTISAGLSMPDAHDFNADAALSIADGCLYEAKTRGRDRIVANLAETGILHKAALLKSATREDRLLVAYQPIVDLSDFRQVGDEALARLRTRDDEILPAGSFVEVAEGLNLMSEIDSHVAGLAMHRCAANLSHGRSDMHFSHFINLSPQFLARRDLVDKLLVSATRHCGDCGLGHGGSKPIVLEITERQAIANLDALANDLAPLLDYGFKLALDDFGSGYSSFLYLCKLPVSFLKIEGWMVSNMVANPKAAELIRSIVQLAKHQGIITIAEFVEDEATALRLREMGVDWAQGYFFGQPAVCA